MMERAILSDLDSHCVLGHCWRCGDGESGDPPSVLTTGSLSGVRDDRVTWTLLCTDYWISVSGT